MIELKYDLHIHSCLSPCGHDDMSPANLVNMAKLAGLQAIALTDHNSALNCPAALKHGADIGLIVIPGLELTTAEEVHVVCLFERLEAAGAFSERVWQGLPAIPTNKVFGDQTAVDENERATLKNEKLLINATDIGIYEVVHLMESYGGFAFPAHIDRAAFSLLSNLGLIDPGMGFNLYELSAALPDKEAFRRALGLSADQIIINSDAHNLASIPDACRSIFVDEASPGGIIRGLKGRGKVYTAP
jgi:hypothetical protein